jgi:hypothetical protein
MEGNNLKRSYVHWRQHNTIVVTQSKCCCWKLAHISDTILWYHWQQVCNLQGGLEVCKLTTLSAPSVPNNTLSSATWQKQQQSDIGKKPKGRNSRLQVIWEIASALKYNCCRKSCTKNYNWTQTPRNASEWLDFGWALWYASLEHRNW